MNVPKFEEYFASKKSMNKDQKSFYTEWLHNWNKGDSLDVEGNISYLFCFVYDVLTLPPAEAVSQLTRLIDSYRDEEKVVDCCVSWRSDCYVLLGDYQTALLKYPSIPINGCSANRTDRLLSLKLITRERITGRDVLSLNGPKVTRWGKEHLDTVVAYLDILVREYEIHHKCNLIEEWKSSSRKFGYDVFSGSIHSKITKTPCYWFCSSPDAVSFVTEKTRDAENSVRDEMNIPRVGEGWIAETELFYALCDCLPSVDVIHHGRPKWLGRQHLDIFIPSLSVALEYQGAQHDQPVDYFGGKEAFELNVKRDAKKKRLCKKHGINLIEVRPGYSLLDLVNRIKDIDRSVG